MRRTVLAGSFALVLVAGLAGGWLLTTTIDQNSEPQWLLSHGSSSAVVEQGRSGETTLTLAEPDPTVLMFTDRPERNTATLDLDSLINQWSDAFGDDPPNAALVDDASGDALAVLTLSKPRRDGDALTFTVLGLDIQPDVEGTLDAGAHLFIDPPAARLTNFHQMPMSTPLPAPMIPDPGGPVHIPLENPFGGLPAAKVNPAE